MRVVGGELDGVPPPAGIDAMKVDSYGDRCIVSGNQCYNTGVSGQYYGLHIGSAVDKILLLVINFTIIKMRVMIKIYLMRGVIHKKDII